MKLSKLINSVKVIQITGNPELKEVSEITYDSRQVRENSLFVAIKGYKTDGHKFIETAINRGACAVILDDNNAVPEQLFIHNNCVKILVKDSRVALAEISNSFFSEPSKQLKLVGVSGTKGKTTTTFFLKNIFENADYKTGLIGTIANIVGGNQVQAKLTTPQSSDINMMMSQMNTGKVTHCVMEVSSHASFLHRVDKLDFDFGVFTNITSDHMDFHETFEHYLSSKKIFFDMLKTESWIVYNIDDEHFNEILRDTKAKKVSYGMKKKSDFLIKDIEYTLEGTEFDLIYTGKTYKLSTKLVGEFNAYNAAAAFAVAVISGVDTRSAVEGIKTTPQVPGRFEVLSKGKKKVIIDYSHTSDSLRQALKALHHIVKDEKPIYTVFGCGGDRDRKKRPEMGEIASNMSKKVFVTSDNPRTEDPFFIIEEILKGIKRDNYEVIENREEAIKKAVYNTENDAVILIAGKGHENYQEINGVRKYFSDKEVAEKYLN